MLHRLEGRQGTEAFARRSIKNLDFVLGRAEQRRRTGEQVDVHPVTQTICTLLATIVFPHEKSALTAIKKKRLVALYAQGWPAWNMSGSRNVRTVGGLVKRLRHAVAHSNVFFDSDSQDPRDVTVTFQNYNKNDRKKIKPIWTASIRADKLAVFCGHFASFIRDRVA